MSDSLPILYERMAALTGPLCARGSGYCHPHTGPSRCCAREYCELARAFALDKYGITLEDAGHEIPFMGEMGCIVVPHLRPLCTLHICDFSWSPAATAPPEYEALRREILTTATQEGKHP